MRPTGGPRRVRCNMSLSGLQAIAPERVTGHYAMLLATRPGAENDELVALLPAAIAAAPEPAAVDSLLTLYGSALEATAGCGQALLQFRAVLRRSSDSTVLTKARTGVAACAFVLGQRADSQGKLLDAALWFAEAARADSVSPIGRRASLRAAESRLAQGDTMAAAITFQSVVSPVPPTRRDRSRSSDSLSGIVPAQDAGPQPQRHP